MYTPKFNSVLVEIEVDQWGGGNDESMLGKSYSKGKVIEFGDIIPTHDYPLEGFDNSEQGEMYKYTAELTGKSIMWNEGTEAGTTFEVDGKLYGFIYWWDVRGVKE